MAPSHDTNHRLAHLEHILAQTTSGALKGTGANAADVHLASVPTDRIRRLTAELNGDASGESDEVDLLVMRLLLNEYLTAVGHLRAVARAAAAAVDGAAAPVREARRALHRYTKTVAATAPSWITPPNADDA